jgi:hypothetical protein
MRKIIVLGAVLTILALPVEARVDRAGQSTSDTGIGKGSGTSDTGIGKGSGTSDTGIGKGSPVMMAPPPPPPGAPPPPPPPPAPVSHAAVMHCHVTGVSGHSFTCRAHHKTYVFHVTHNRMLRHIKVGRHVRVKMHFHHHQHYADQVTVLR